MAFTEQFYKSRNKVLVNKSTQERGFEKLILALNWVYRWGYSFPSVLDQVGNVKARGLSAKLVKQGLLKSTKTALSAGFQGVPNQMLTLTDEGVRIVENHVDLQYAYETDPYRIRQDQLRHYFITQSVTMRAINQLKVEAYETEKEYANFSENGVKQPDVIWIAQDGKRFGIEVELTGKWDRKLHQFIYSSIAALKKNVDGVSALDYIIIYGESDALIKRYKESFLPGQTHARWIKNNRGYWQQDSKFAVPEWSSGKVICKKY